MNTILLAVHSFLKLSSTQQCIALFSYTLKNSFSLQRDLHPILLVYLQEMSVAKYYTRDTYM